MDAKTEKIVVRGELARLKEAGAPESLGSLADHASGRELDALVAEHVMGFRWYRDVTDTDPNVVFLALSANVDYNSDSFHLVKAGEPRELNGSEFFLVPPYSYEGNAILAILTRMGDLNFAARINFAPHGIKVWHVEFTVPSTEYWASGKFLPEVICRAALKAAIGEQVNNNVVRPEGSGRTAG